MNGGPITEYYMNGYGCHAHEIYEIERMCPSSYPMFTIYYLKRMSMNVRNMSYLLNERSRISKMHNPEKLATLGTQNEKGDKTNAQHPMCWTPLYKNKHI